MSRLEIIGGKMMNLVFPGHGTTLIVSAVFLCCWDRPLLFSILKGDLSPELFSSIFFIFKRWAWLLLLNSCWRSMKKLLLLFRIHFLCLIERSCCLLRKFRNINFAQVIAANSFFNISLVQWVTKMAYHLSFGLRDILNGKRLAKEVALRPLFVSKTWDWSGLWDLSHSVRITFLGWSGTKPN